MSDNPSPGAKIRRPGAAAGNRAPGSGRSRRSPSSDRIRAVRLLGRAGGGRHWPGCWRWLARRLRELRLAVVQALGRSPPPPCPVIAAIDRARAREAAQRPAGGRPHSRPALPECARSAGSWTGGGGGPTLPRHQPFIRGAGTRHPGAGPARCERADAGVRGSGPRQPRARWRANEDRLALCWDGRGNSHRSCFRCCFRSCFDLAAVREQSDDAVLRFLATRELGTLPGPSSLVPLRGALTDVDPRVRETAAQGLGFTATPLRKRC